MKSVVVIHFDVDRSPSSDLSIEEMSKGKFQKRLKNQEYGSRPVFAKPGEQIYTHSFVGLLVVEGKIITRKDE